MSFRPQDADIFRPYPDEVPWELLAEADPSDERHDEYGDADMMRVAKLDDTPIGVYVIKALEPTRYELVNLSVAEGFRHQGLGRWLLGHAIGLAETKGGREILVRKAPLRGLFRRVGFEVSGEGLLLKLTPE